MSRESLSYCLIGGSRGTRQAQWWDSNLWLMLLLPYMYLEKILPNCMFNLYLALHTQTVNVYDVICHPLGIRMLSGMPVETN